MNYIENLVKRYPVLAGEKENIEKAVDAILSMYENDGKLLLCGNGGSASDCEHISGELLKGFMMKRGDTKLQKGIMALPFPSFSALLSAFANDVDPELVFAQLSYAFARKNDVLMGLSTSGNSKNVCEAVLVAKKAGAKTIGLTGATGGKLRELCDICISVPETETYKVQELHLPVYHAVCAEVEERIFGGK